MEVTKDFAELAGRVCRSMEEEETETLKRKYIRCHVVVDITQSLKRGGFIRMDNDKHIWVAFKYERLLTACSYCGVLRHEGDCLSKEGKKNYGRWIRAEVEEVWEPDGTNEEQNASVGSNSMRKQPREQTRPDPDITEVGDRTKDKWVICTYDRNARKASMVRNEERSFVVVERRDEIAKEGHTGKQEELSRLRMR